MCRIWISVLFLSHLLQLGHSTVSALNQVGGLLADVARHFAPVALDQSFGVVSLHGLEDSRQYEHTTLQTVLCSLEGTETHVRVHVYDRLRCERLFFKITDDFPGGAAGLSLQLTDRTSGISLDPRARGPSRFR